MLFLFKQKTAYEMRISDWSSDVCSSDLRLGTAREEGCGFFFTVERKPIKGVQRRPIYGPGHQLAIDLSQHAMLIRPPLRKAREIIENLCRIGMENMRAILMNEDARSAQAIMRIAPDVGAAIDQQNLLARADGEALSHD